MTRGGPGAIRKRSVMISGHRTSVSLEAAFWEALRETARARNASVQALIAEIDSQRAGNNLSSAIRVYVLETYRRRQAEQSSVEERGRNVEIGR